MIDITTLKTSLLNVCGWRPNYDPAGAQLQDLTTTESGIYLNDEHPLLTHDNLQSIAPNFDRVTYPAWAVGTTYTVGNVVTYSSVTYRALRTTVGDQPNTSTEDWIRHYPYTEWIREKTQGSIAKVIVRWIEEKAIQTNARSIFSQVNLFEGAGRIADTIANDGKLAGFEINFRRGSFVKVVVESIAVQASEAGTFTLYLHSSGQPAAVDSQSVVYATAGAVQWVDVNWELKYDDDPGAAYYVVYDQNALPGLAINKAKDWSVPPCVDCSRGDFRSYRLWSKYIEVHPLAVEGTAGTLWEIQDNAYDYNKNYGLNMRLSVHCDLTAWVTRNRLEFKNAIAKQVSVDLLREMAYNPNSRIGRKESTINFNKGELLYEIDGNTQGRRTGKAYELDLAIKALHINTQGIDQPCLPCKKGGVKYRSI
jgi:hypothetical protein